jgi:hypothetical protein
MLKDEIKKNINYTKGSKIKKKNSNEKMMIKIEIKKTKLDDNYNFFIKCEI